MGVRLAMVLGLSYEQRRRLLEQIPAELKLGALVTTGLVYVGKTKTGVVLVLVAERPLIVPINVRVSGR